MPSIPLPIVLSLMLITLLLSQRERLLGVPTGRVFLAAAGLYALALVVVGARWGWGWRWLLPLLPPLAAVVSALLWIGFRGLSRAGAVVDRRRDGVHALPVLALIALGAVWPAAIEPLVVAIQLGYAGLLAGLARRGADALRLVRLETAQRCLRALWLCVAALALGALVDTAIALDFALYQGRHAEALIAAVILPAMCLAALAAAEAGMGASRRGAGEVPEQSASTSLRLDAADGAGPADENEADAPDAAEDLALMARLDGLLGTLYTDPELNLQRLARKAGVPARQVSQVINRQRGVNVSQWVNAARIEAACAVLRDPEATVQQAMFDAGFVTRSNFNREFRRVKGASPSAWRRALAAH